MRIYINGWQANWDMVTVGMKSYMELSRMEENMLMEKYAEGERERLILGCRCLTKEEIDKKQSFIDSLGNRLPSRQELISEASQMSVLTDGS